MLGTGFRGFRHSCRMASLLAVPLNYLAEDSLIGQADSLGLQLSFGELGYQASLPPWAEMAPNSIMTGEADRKRSW